MGVLSFALDLLEIAALEKNTLIGPFIFIKDV